MKELTITQNLEANFKPLALQDYDPDFKKEFEYWEINQSLSSANNNRLVLGLVRFHGSLVSSFIIPRGRPCHSTLCCLVALPKGLRERFEEETGLILSSSIMRLERYYREH